MNNKNWFVVHTKPRKEYVAMENLQRQGFAAYCPKTLQQKRRGEYWKKVIEPLFPRYLFIQLNVGVDNFNPIRSTLGVIGLVRFGNQPAVLPELAIETIKHQEKAIKSRILEHQYWQKGDIVEIVEGPFAGLMGVFQQKKTIERVSLLLEVLGQQNRISVNCSCLSPNVCSG